MPEIASKIVPAGAFKAVDADQVEETTDAKVLTADERTQIAAGVTHAASLANPHGVTKSQVGLPNVDDVSAAALRDRTTHTGVQLPETVSSLSQTLAQILSAIGGVDNSSAPITLEGAEHPWLVDISSLVMALTDPDGNLGIGVKTDGDLLVKILRVLGGIETEAFSVGRESSQYPFAIGDRDGNVGLALTKAMTILTATGAEIGGESDWDFAVVDADLNVGLGMKDGVFYWPQQTSSQIGIAELDLRNRSFSQSVRDTAIVSVQPPTAVYNVIVNWGQSLAEGYQTWPSLSKTPEPGAMMIGDNVDNTAGANTYEVIGTLQFNPLVAYTRSGSTNLSDAEEAELIPGDGAAGEPPVIGLTNSLKRSLNRRSLSENDGRNLVAISPAVGGKTIEQLSKGALNTQDAIDRYSILTDGIAKVVTLAGADTCVVPLVTWAQGEWNYADHGGSYNRATYESLLRSMLDNVSADAVAATGQSFGPLFVMYQTGAAYTRDVDEFGAPGLHVGMAQLDVALDRGDTVMSGPVYPYTDRGGHLEANGSRWFGHQMSKVARKVLLDGEDWQPLRPIEILQEGSEVLISFHVPVAPLVFDTPYVTTTATDYPAKGFRVSSADDVTDYPITAVEIVADTVIRLTMASEPPADALVWYADKTVHEGNGNVRDSDRTVAIDSYEYVPERGAYAADNVLALVDKPYALHNWSVAFCLPINYSEF